MRRVYVSQDREVLVIWEDGSEGNEESFEILNLVGDSDRKLSERPRYKGKEKSGKRAGRHCKSCGEQGHRADGCSKNVSLKEKVEKLKADGMNSKEVAEKLGISVTQANRLW